eukprot:TRINITY_DN8396_c0_g2_i1.p1 TRINITY_DN8396_c0_g2~~TRINITY_DN8396_c0_g2_i1.p1  ORF type:complete len:191 (+),score=7.25 TRINITY_DN8396_c0_g2_i1:696-1268(+)
MCLIEVLPHCAILKKYLDMVTKISFPTLFNSLTSQKLQNFMVQLPNLTHISMHSHSIPTFLKILASDAVKLSSVQVLKTGLNSPDDEKDIDRILAKTSQIKSLEINFNISEHILDSIANRCQTLESLHFAASNLIPLIPGIINILLNCRRLSSLFIDTTRIYNLSINTPGQLSEWTQSICTMLPLSLIHI